MGIVHNMMGGGSSGGSGFPEFTYTGAYTLIDDGDGNWRIKFTTSGTLNFSKLGKGNGSIDIFCVGGGASGQCGAGTLNPGGGGGGGYTHTTFSQIAKETDYLITVGDGGASNSSRYAYSAGGKSSFANLLEANGSADSNGGSGAGGGYSNNGAANGADASSGGTGQGYTTGEFEDSSDTAMRYSSGGGGGDFGWKMGEAGKAGIGSAAAGGRGGYNSGYNAAPNTGCGGGGGGVNEGASASGAGGSGIVVIRNHRS